MNICAAPVFINKTLLRIMTNSKDNKRKKTEKGKEVHKPGLEPSKENNEFQNIIPSDKILAEKDEVKNAEERLRRKKEEVKGRRWKRKLKTEN